MILTTGNNWNHEKDWDNVTGYFHVCLEARTFNTSNRTVISLPSPARPTTNLHDGALATLPRISTIASLISYNFKTLNFALWKVGTEWTAQTRLMNIHCLGWEIAWFLNPIVTVCGWESLHKAMASEDDICWVHPLTNTTEAFNWTCKRISLYTMVESGTF